MTKEQYQSIQVTELRALAKTRGIKKISSMKKAELIDAMLELDAAEAKKSEEMSALREKACEVLKTSSEKYAPDKESEALKAAEAPVLQKKNAAAQEEGGLERQAQAAAAGEAGADCRSAADKEPAAVTLPEKSPVTGDAPAVSNALKAQDDGDLRPAGVSYDERDNTERRAVREQPAVRTSTEIDEAAIRAQKLRKETELSKSGVFARGVLEILADGFGFIRTDNYLPGEDDAYVSLSQIRRFGLKTGDMLEGQKRPEVQGERSGGLWYISSVNDCHPEEAKTRPTFESMTPIFPDKRIRMEREGGSRAMRIVDLISPIGRGARGMIVSPPKAGKTTLLKDVAQSIIEADPEIYLIILLIDERPEEVTDIRETVRGDRVEVVYSTFDETAEHHRKVSEMVIERAKRLVEHHKDVVILLDSITRLTRAYNVLVPPSGRTLSGGLDPAALNAPKRFFGAARNMREGGSLTILATALVDTGSKMDDVVYEEFKGTGNMELILDRKLQERRVFPAIDIVKSGTRREDLLLTPKELKAVDLMRRRTGGAKADEAIEQIINAVSYYPENAQVVDAILSKWQN